jgi:uncharacterized membrane protein HdeD (DUF308 family)
MIQTSGKDFKGLVDGIVSFVDSSVIPLLFALAFIFFLIGVARYFFSQSDEEREKGRQFVIWGIIGLVVLFSLWGIVNLFLALIK